MRKIITFLLPLVLLSGMNSARALSNSERTYQIELIVFSHITAQGLHSERWPQISINSTPPSRTVTFLPKNDLVLTSEQRLLARNKNYHVLLHLAWRQRIPHPNQAQAIHIYGGNIYNSS